MTKRLTRQFLETLEPYYLQEAVFQGDEDVRADINHLKGFLEAFDNAKYFKVPINPLDPNSQLLKGFGIKDDPEIIYDVFKMGKLVDGLLDMPKMFGTMYDFAVRENQPIWDTGYMVIDKSKDMRQMFNCAVLLFGENEDTDFSYYVDNNDEKFYVDGESQT